MRLDFTDYLPNTIRVRRRILEASDFILNDQNMTIRRASKELCIPRTTLRRYLDEYLIRLTECFDYDEHHELIDYGSIHSQIQRRIRDDKIKYQSPSAK